MTGYFLNFEIISTHHSSINFNNLQTTFRRFTLSAKRLWSALFNSRSTHVCSICFCVISFPESRISAIWISWLPRTFFTTNGKRRFLFNLKLTPFNILFFYTQLPLLKSPLFTVTLLFMFVSSLGINFIEPNIQIHLLPLSLKPVQLGFVFFIPAFIYTILTPFIGFICDKVLYFTQSNSA